MKKLIFFGAGEGSREVLHIIINDINKIKPTWQVLGFVDDDPKKSGINCDGYPVFGGEYNGDTKDIYGACGLMNNHHRNRIIEDKIIAKGFSLASLIHPSIIKSDDFEAGEGLIIFPGVKISYNVKLGRGVMVNYNCLLGHDLRVGDYSFIGPSVTIPGRCQIGRLCLIGAGATFVPGIKIEDNSIIGAGSTIFSNVRKNSSVVDLPRKLTKQI